MHYIYKQSIKVSMKNRLFLSALTLLGFGGCSEGSSLFNEPDMYGVPLVDYHFMGEVTDAEGNPIKGIEVKVGSSEDIATTDDNGTFSSDFSTYADGSYIITLTDIDGVENGGEFATKQIDFTVPYTDSQEFDLGTVILDPKEE